MLNLLTKMEIRIGTRIIHQGALCSFVSQQLFKKGKNNESNSFKQGYLINKHNKSCVIVKQCNYCLTLAKLWENFKIEKAEGTTM